MFRNLNLNALIYFEAVARHSSVLLAAKELNVSASAVSQQIILFEKGLGICLFRRLKKRMVLTEEGERFFESTVKSLGILRETHKRIFRGSLASNLVIRVAASFGVSWLAPRLTRFINANPECELHIDATTNITEFDKENVDVEIRYDPLPPLGLYSRTIIHDRVLPMCSPSLLPKKPIDAKNLLMKHRLIHTVKANIRWSDWLAYHGLKGVKTETGLRFDRSLMSLQCAKAGLGIVMESATHALDALASKDLVPLMPELGTIDFPAYAIICPARNLERSPAKEFIAWITEESKIHEAEKDALLKKLGCKKYKHLKQAPSVSRQ